MADIRLEKRSPVTRASGARSEIHIVVMQNVNRIVTEPEHGASFLSCIILLSLGMTTQEPSQVIADWDDWGECSVLPACFRRHKRSSQVDMCSQIAV